MIRRIRKMATPNKSGYIKFAALMALLFPALLIPLFLSSQELSSEETEVYRKIADSLVARVLDNPTIDLEYRELIRRARRIDPENGDAHYLAATFISEIQERQVEREALLRSALVGTLRRITRDDVIRELVDTLFLQRRYREALDLFHREEMNGTTPLPLEYDVLPVVGVDTEVVTDASFPTDADELSVRYLHAQLMSGPYWYSTAYLQRLRSRYPMDDNLAELDFFREGRVSLAFREWIDYRSSTGMEIPGTILLHGVRHGTTPEFRRDLAGRYIADGGSDPLAWMAARKEYLLDQEDWKADKVVWETAKIWFDKDFYSELELPGGESVLFVDESRDTFWEERYHFSDGNLRLWEDDSDQNGIVDLRVQIDTKSRRVDVSVRLSETEVLEYRYAPYPLVSEVLRTTRNEENDPVYRVVRWIPAQPPVHPIGLEQVLSDQWDGRYERVTLNSDVFNRFDRQLQSDDARRMSMPELQQYVELLLERGIIYQE